MSIIPLTLCAATGAWEAVRLRRSGLIDNGAAARPPLVVALSQLCTVWAVGLLCVLVALACVADRARGGPGGPDLRVLALLSILVFAYTLAGYAVGWLMPWMLTVPAVLVATFLWLIYPKAMEPLWLRQLNGTNLDEGWSYERTLATKALIAPGLVAAGLLLAALIVMMARTRIVRLLALLPAAVMAAVAVSLVVPMQYDATKPRETSALSCAGRPVQVCLWPEQLRDRDNFRSWSKEAAMRLKKAGVEPPGTYSPVFSDPEREDVIMSLVSSMMPDSGPACFGRHAWPGEEAYVPVAMWLELTAGGRTEDVASRIDDAGKTLSLVESVRKLPIKTQRQWYNKNRLTLMHCDLEPELTATAYLSDTK
ncbi:hypothetical protein AB0F42_34175 [Streptomyces buecherae]|uniref:DUF7224 domain-containing protein n=1 Tax=Streptomyces buecherae TaxID=2763006 RepID=UPI00340B83DE